MTRAIDRTSIEGKEFPTEDHFPLVVIGAPERPASPQPLRRRGWGCA